MTQRVLIVGAGIGGLATAARLAAAGCAVTVLEAAAAPGGKLRRLVVGGQAIDSGPTVFTMRWVFEELFEACGRSFAGAVGLTPLRVLARHAWPDGTRLDLFADPEQTEAAIEAGFGSAAAAGFAAFRHRAASVYATLDAAFIRAPRPSPLGLARRIGAGGIARITPFRSYWGALGTYFPDPRLRQLFSRYATYCGADPFTAPATLMLVAHVESEGVWSVQGGMSALVTAVASLAESHGAVVRCQARVAEIIRADGRARGVRLASGERLEADAVVLNADPAALIAGLFGRALRPKASRALPGSLSAFTLSMLAKVENFPLLRHNLFFSPDYAEEFRDLSRRRRLPVTPTLYLCAEDRTDTPDAPEAERLFCIANAPPLNGRAPDSAAALDATEATIHRIFHEFGMTLRCLASERTTPQDFDRLFPATGGALYGPATIGPYASFRRPGARTALPGLYLAGGSVHPGPGVPMAVLSGRIAALAVLGDGGSISRFRRVGIAGFTRTG